MSDLISQLLDRFRLDALLGEAGMGSVFRASDITLRRDVAVKVNEVDHRSPSLRRAGFAVGG